MVVLILEKATPGLRGELSRWLIQPKAGVYFGFLSARVRDLLWQRIQSSIRDGGALLVHSDDNEQGFSVRTTGCPSKLMVDYDGLTLPKTPKVPKPTPQEQRTPDTSAD